MLEFRSFRNTDPPRLTGIWRSRAGDPALLQPVSVDLFEQLIFGKLHFDYAGLILAFEDGKPVGFAHASFGPDAAGSGVSRETGVICLIVVRPDCEETAVAAGLLDRCEAYLRQRGARVFYGGGIPPLSPFYAGLYGGCELPGVLESDKVSRVLYPARGYAPVDRCLLLQRDLSTFRAPVDRQQVQCRRSLLVQVLMDPPAKNRWEAMTTADFGSTRFELLPRGGGRHLAYAVARATEWGNASRSGRIAGLVDLFVEPASRRQGLGTHLVGELARVLSGQGVAFLETQPLQRNEPLVQFCRKLGFQQIADGIVYRKEVRDS